VPRASPTGADASDGGRGGGVGRAGGAAAPGAEGVCASAGNAPLRSARCGSAEYTPLRSDRGYVPLRSSLPAATARAGRASASWAARSERNTSFDSRCSSLDMYPKRAG
jgi:hypothetical protein